MANLNKVMLIGNLTRDPEVKPAGSSTVAKLGLAINRTFTANNEKREETTFVDVVLWGKLAELAGEYLAKGRSVYIEGRLNLETWDEKETGAKRSKMTVVGEVMQFLSQKPETSRGEDTGRAKPPVGGKAISRPVHANSPSNDDEDDIPF